MVKWVEWRSSLSPNMDHIRCQQSKQRTGKSFSKQKEKKEEAEREETMKRRRIKRNWLRI